MTPLHTDIITVIGRKQPITTAGIAEYLMDHFGYGGGMEFDAFRDHVSKTIGYLKNKGEIVGYDAPQEKGKPLRHWLLPHPQPECQSAEMASDVVEVESANSGYLEDIHGPIATHKKNLTVADADMVATLDALDTEREIQERQAVAETLTPEPVSVEVKVERKTPISVSQALAGKHPWMGGSELTCFLLGIEFAEKHHGISQ